METMQGPDGGTVDASRPIEGWRASTGKYWPETRMPRPDSVCPPNATLAPKVRCAAMPVKLVCTRSRSRNIG